MALKLPANLTGLRTFPHKDEFTASIPLTGLLAYYRKGSLITLDASSKVQTWGSYGMKPVTQVDATKRPSYDAVTTEIIPDGVDDYFPTDISPPTSGYLVFTAVSQGAVTGSRYIIGHQQSVTQRVMLGYSATPLLSATIGSVTLQAAGTVTSGTKVTAGLHWHNGTATLRKNGVASATNTYNAGGEGVGTNKLFLLARNFAGAPSTYSNWKVRGVAVYSQTGGFTTTELAAIDTAMAAL